MIFNVAGIWRIRGLTLLWQDLIDNNIVHTDGLSCHNVRILLSYLLLLSLLSHNCLRLMFHRPSYGLKLCNDAKMSELFQLSNF